MDERVTELYGKFIKHKMYGKALDVLETSYAEDPKGTYPLIEKFRRGQTALARIGKEEAFKHLRRSYFMTARDVFDDFCIAMEWERPAGQRFYLPRRKQLLPIVKQMQRLADGDITILGISMPPGTGKTGLAQFFLDFQVGKNPLLGNLIASHNTTFLRGLYEETLRELDPDGEYCWHEIFPERAVVKTNALDLKIDVDKAQRFSSYQYRSIQGGNAGLSRAVGLLYVDDIIEGIEEAMSEERLEAKWTKFNTDLLQRTQGDCKLLVIMTRWSVRDPLGRLEARYADDPHAVFIRVPALDKRDHSNFDYGGNIGFSTAYYRNLREMMDKPSWEALYMSQPIERSGILYNTDELQRFFDLPTEEPDGIWAVCDTKNKGDDFFCMPIAYQYGDKFYIVSIICDDKTPEVVEPRLVNALLRWNVKLARFESNSAGGRIAENVQNKVKEQGGITKITTKYSTANKETRIIVDSAFVKEHFLFRDASKYDSEYRAAMNFLVSYTMSGKNRHDDVPDAMSMLADFVQVKVRPQAIIMQRPF
jgi:predicted phage terminase large subunit-like protein